LTDALLGSVGAGDIGGYFPPSDPKWKNANSVLFVQEAMRHLQKAQYVVSNVDCTLIAAEPKIGPHAREIRESIAKLLGVGIEQVSIKAKTPEGTGTDNAAIAHAFVLVEKKRKS
jgi:2-C-methyl-D-erythritol 2,4-cyclodiphosphate synthase